MNRVGLYVVVGLLCLAMAGGVFLGGGPPAANNQRGGAAAQEPAIGPLDAAAQKKLAQQREVAANLVKKAGADSESLTGIDGRVAGLQKVIDGGLDKLSVWELQCLGALLGDALAEGTPVEWVLVRAQGRAQAALAAPGGDSVFFPMEVFGALKEDGGALKAQEVYDVISRRVTSAPAAPAAK